MKQEYNELFRLYPEARREVVELIKGGVSTGKLSKSLGVTRQCLYNWVSLQMELDSLDKDPEFQSVKRKLYKIVEDFECKPPEEREKERWYAKKVLISDHDLKARIVNLVEDQGHTLTDVSRQVGVVASNIKYWDSELEYYEEREDELVSRLKKFRGTLGRFRN